MGVALLIDCGCDGVPLWQNMTKRSMHSHKVYKPSPNKQVFPRLCPISLYNNSYTLLVYTYIVLLYIQWRADRMDHESFSSTFLRIYCSLNIVVYSFMLCSCATLPLV